MYLFNIARSIINMTNYHYTEFKVKLYPNVFDAASIGGDVHLKGVEVSIIGVSGVCFATKVASKEFESIEHNFGFKITVFP